MNMATTIAPIKALDARNEPESARLQAMRESLVNRSVACICGLSLEFQISAHQVSELMMQRTDFVRGQWKGQEYFSAKDRQTEPEEFLKIGADIEFAVRVLAEVFPKYEPLVGLSGQGAIGQEIKRTLRKCTEWLLAKELVPTYLPSVRFNAPTMVLLFREIFGDGEKVRRFLREFAGVRQFDVFCCYNREDRKAVMAIARELERRGISTWLDEWRLRPGYPWQRMLEEQIGQINSAAVFVGEAGVGPWQQVEIEAFLREFVARRCPVIPVLLEQAAVVPRLPIFMNAMTWVDFRVSDPEPVQRLVWGITGIPPSSS